MKKVRFSRLELLALGLFLLAGATACVVVLMFPPGSPRTKWLPKCLFHEWTGLYCPGCGGTRALYALLQLRKRNLTLFLEAAGWAVNLPMRLNAKVSHFFSRENEVGENVICSDVNVYDILNSGKLILTRAAAEKIQEVYGK